MKTFFLTRTSREKMLLLLLVLGGALMWLTSVGGRVSTFITDYKMTRASLERQAKMLGMRDSIKAREKAAIQQLDPSHTFDFVRLQAELNTMATIAGVTNPTISDAHTEKTAQFAVNSAQIAMRNTDYAALVKFYEELKKRAPYIGLEQLTISPNATNGNLLTITVKVSSVEIAK